MIHFRIRRVFQELLHIKMFLGIRAFSVLLFAKFKFHDIHTLGAKYTEFTHQTLSDFFHFSLDFPAFLFPFSYDPGNFLPVRGPVRYGLPPDFHTGG